MASFLGRPSGCSLCLQLERSPPFSASSRSPPAHPPKVTSAILRIPRNYTIFAGRVGRVDLRDRCYRPRPPRTSFRRPGPRSAIARARTRSTACPGRSYRRQWPRLVRGPTQPMTALSRHRPNPPASALVVRKKTIRSDPPPRLFPPPPPLLATSKKRRLPVKVQNSPRQPQHLQLFPAAASRCQPRGPLLPMAGPVALLPSDLQTETERRRKKTRRAKFFNRQRFPRKLRHALFTVDSGSL